MRAMGPGVDAGDVWVVHGHFLPGPTLDIGDGGGRQRQKQDSFGQHVERSLGRCLVACSTVGLQAASCEM